MAARRAANHQRWRDLQASKGGRVVRSRRHCMVKYAVLIVVGVWLAWMLLIVYQFGMRNKKAIMDEYSQTSKTILETIQTAENEASMAILQSLKGSGESEEREAEGSDIYKASTSFGIRGIAGSNAKGEVWIALYQDVEFPFPLVIPKICGVKLFLSEQFSSEDQVPAAFKDESRLVAETQSNDVDECCVTCAESNECTALKYHAKSCLLLSIKSGDIKPDEVVPMLDAEKEDGAALPSPNAAAAEKEEEVDEQEEETKEKDGPETDDVKEDSSMEANEGDDVVHEENEADGGEEGKEDAVAAEDDIIMMEEEEENASPQGSPVEEKEEAPAVAKDDPPKDSFMEDDDDDLIDDMAPATEAPQAEASPELEVNTPDASSEEKTSEEDTSAIDVTDEPKIDDDNSGNDEAGGNSNSGGNGGIGISMPMGDFPEELAPVERTGGEKLGQELNDMLQVEDGGGFNTGSVAAESVLNIDEIGKKFSGALRPGEVGDAGEDALGEESAVKKEENLFEEKRLSQDTATSLSKMKLTEFLPIGEYKRQIQDPFYKKSFKFFYRFRTNRDINELQGQIVTNYRKSRKRLHLMHLAVGKTGDKNKMKNIKVLQMGNPSRGRHVFVVGALRGCEWVPPMAILHTAMALIGRGEPTLPILEALRFHFIAVPNPDGYEYSHRRSPSSARHFCKNRKVAFGTHGVDLERNWGLDGVSWGFGKRGKDGAKRADFQGASNFSEPETRAIRDYMRHFTSGRGRSALLHVRCCSGVVTPPQLYRKEYAEKVNVAKVAELFTRVATQESSKYSVGKREDEFNAKNTGLMIDWAHTEAMVDHAYTFEIKASGLTTRANHLMVSEEPFLLLSQELERAVVFVAQLLLSMEIEGPPKNSNFKPRPGSVLLSTKSADDKPSSSSKSKKKKHK